MTDLLRTITAHYLIFVFLASLGMLQLAGARSRAQHLLLLDGRRKSAILGVGLILAGYLFFFTKAQYGIPGLEGAQLFLEFGGTAFLALLTGVGANVARSGQIGVARRALRRRMAASAAELRPLFSAPRRYRVEDEVT